jgi:hypothetical protein
MSISLPRYTSGDTNYVANLNNTNETVENSINSLSNQLIGIPNSSISVGTYLPAALGTVTSLIGVTSCVPTGSGATLTVPAGYVWVPSASTVVSKAANTISFTGLAAATYYVDVDSTGSATRQTSSGGNTIYAVAWTGSAFGAITRVCPVLWSAADIQAAQLSAAYGTTYFALDDRFEASESKINALQALPYDVDFWQSGKPAAGQVLKKLKVSKNTTYPASLTGSTVVTADAAATANAVFSIAKNGVEFATLTYSAGSANGVFAGTVSYFAAGDLLSVKAPASQDATLSGVGFVLSAFR